MTKKNTISPEDLALFHAEMREVTPLKSQKPKIRSERILPSSQPVRRKHFITDEAPAVTLWDLSDYYHDPVAAESLLIFHHPGIGKQHIQTLRTGNLSLEAKLDLHGLKPDAAKKRLCQFLQQQIQQQRRWVLIIHGKGGRFGEMPVLKNLVNHWLRQIPSVLAFHSAQSKHGGNGAVYVLLKKCS